jgi:cytochrome c oxidase assembly factor CtaG
MHMGPGNMAPVRIDLHTLFRYWLVSPFTCLVLAGLVLAAFWYFQATRDLAEQGEAWPAARTAAFFAGLVAIELAFQSSVAMFPYISFPMEVLQKLLLLVVAPPLLVRGAPLSLALESSSPTTTRRLLGAIRSGPARVLTHPVLLFFLYYVGLVAFYLTSALASSMQHVWLLDLINLGVLAVAVLFWTTVLNHQVTSPRALVALLGAGTLVQVGLGIDLIIRATPAAAIYTLAGTHAGGAVLLAGTVLSSVAVLLRNLTQWYLDTGSLEADAHAEPIGAGEHPVTAAVQASPQG